ncbi:plasmid replication protein RepC [Marivita sp. S0852]|uniref:plasmid replication protein RepC n=1 Tax=Marivita sp. S0852 TaxID=3373893 RepID=UPI003981D6AC
MSFTKLTITGNDTPRAGDNGASKPDTDIWAIFRALRDAHAEYGLRPNHMQTLQAMLSFLKPGQGETVFASNFEICRRVGGIDERTLRRHINRLVETGFVTRHDSPNRKRYRVRSSEGACISYGLSLTPMIARADELLTMAQKVENTRRDCVFVRKQILTKLAQIEDVCPTNPLLPEIKKTLRRKLSLTEYRALLAQTDAECHALSTAVDAPETTLLSANTGQNVRHHSTSVKENKDIQTNDATDLRVLTSVCDQATAFATEDLRSWDDVDRHAETLAPMMGIHPTLFTTARKSVGHRKTACAIFIMLQLGNRIRNFGAYFKCITLGKRKSQFNPSLILKRMARMDAHPA